MVFSSAKIIHHENSFRELNKWSETTTAWRFGELEAEIWPLVECHMALSQD